MPKQRKPYQLNVIPAAPDWRVALPVLNEQKKVTELFFEPIIAWIVQTHEDVEGGLFYSIDPVTPHGSYCADDQYAISPPDKTMTLPADRDFANANELLEHWWKQGS